MGSHLSVPVDAAAGGHGNAAAAHPPGHLQDVGGADNVSVGIDPERQGREWERRLRPKLSGRVNHDSQRFTCF